MSIKPEEINAGKLPSAVRGYQREATENLLKLVAWDYRRALRDKTTAAEEAQQLKGRTEELEAEVQHLREQLEQRVSEGRAELEAENARLRAELEAEAGRKELTQSLLSIAMNAAREAREQARTECDALIRSARRRAIQIEEEARRSVKNSSSEIVRLQKLERDLREQLRRTLEQVIGGETPPAPPRPAEQPSMSGALLQAAEQTTAAPD